ncbi:PfkB family carbohydrate kinase [Pelagibacterium montanilacus]|uniref:PfkB family carbohydrate kinase n=1 Tax=Pelagibacterium montanilacus TaxID=2185280 RepID=UPI000F8D82DE|nr:PfkB family carbohydrate kinase [Pelagibacterium montanilacus]
MAHPWLCCVGDNCIDRIGPPVSRDLVGGNAVNVAVQGARLGLRASYFGAVGADPEGALVRAMLERETVDLGGLVVRPGATALTEIGIDGNGERHMLAESFGACAGYRPDAAAMARIAAAGHCHVGWMDDRGALLTDLLARSRRPSLSRDVSINAHPADLDVAGLDIAFASEPGPREAAVARARDLVTRGAAMAVVTRGPDGALALRDGHFVEVDAVPARVLDSTGAGDSFIAGFLFVWLTTGAIGEALETGARTAARTCEHAGGFSQ